ncbi:hypothetical protein DPMN_062369 [Dreissena polymorpha]|uniref:Uncharacterized protein n=1 Tax=Dreissena polymorpha TaxID=45954 RepID=A0A9D4C8P8_DREPO|nr:hypothetical protein DPMN_062369 [Dreissena polymorpha]
MSVPNQPRNFAFPKRTFGKKKPDQRSFQSSWFDSFTWLHYDEASILFAGFTSLIHICMFKDLDTLRRIHLTHPHIVPVMKYKQADAVVRADAPSIRRLHNFTAAVKFLTLLAMVSPAVKFLTLLAVVYPSSEVLIAVGHSIPQQ